MDNPNNIKASDITKPVAATYLANGALAAVSNGYGYTLAPYSVATDELDWSGPRDAWHSLEQGTITDHLNEFSDVPYDDLAQARWVAESPEWAEKRPEAATALRQLAGDCLAAASRLEKA